MVRRENGKERRTATSKRMADKSRKDHRAIILSVKQCRKDIVAEILGGDSEQRRWRLT